MSVTELAYQKTHLGELILRRRTEARLNDAIVYEVKLGQEYLMSSLFTESERQLAYVGLAGLPGELDVVVGGLGLGFTALSVLEQDRVRSLLVIDLFQEVIDWHRSGLVPSGQKLTADTRCELRQGDFFELARTGFDVSDRDRKFDAVLLDIDHSPEHFLNESNRSFYTPEGFGSIKDQLRVGGSFALWSNDPTDKRITKRLEDAFGHAAAHDIEFANPYTNSTSVNSVYVARKDPEV